MAILLFNALPEGVTLEMLDSVTKVMNVENDPPEGLLLHAEYEQNGRVNVIDVWDAREQYERFIEARLGPAMQQVATQYGIPPMSMEEASAGLTELQAHNVIMGK